MRDNIISMYYEYRIPVNFNIDSKINVIYGNSLMDTKGFNTRIVENEMQNDISGYLKNEEEKTPLFEKPINLNEKGKTLVIYVDEDDEYPCVVLENNGITIGFDIFNEVGHLLSGYLEPFWKSKVTREQLAKIPVVDYYEKILFDCLMLASKKSNIQLNYKSFWPDGKEFAVCLTHDVDRVKKTFQYVTHTFKHLKKGKIGLVFSQILPLLKRQNSYWNFDRIMEMEQRLGVKSTFFFLNEQRKFFCSPSEWKLYWGRYDIKDAKIVETIKRLDAEGWEIGIHGSYNSHKDLKLLEEEKKVLEEILGKKVHGISQHYCNLENPRTWESHEKLGLAYDSTTGFVTDIGFRWGTCHPFHPFNPTNGRIISVWELPIIIMDNACVYKNWEDIVDVINVVERNNGLLLLRWHQEVFYEREFPGRSKIYERIIEMCKERNAWITNASSIAEWLRMREKDR
jgi:peptidoglycan/xylan/chitin deacetylase (PgdA/CDA1 family)